MLDPGKIVAISSHQQGNDALLSAGADVVCSKLRLQEINAVLSG